MPIAAALLMLAGPLPKSPVTLPVIVHSGRRGETAVKPPRLSGAVVIDGILDEPMWSQAAVLTDFSQYTPIDGAAAPDATEVLVWYSSTALHFGIRAFAPAGTVRSTLADRDQIFGDDYIGIFLSTFNDGRQATVFAVNPLGIQGDGAMNESGRSGGREPTDISQDFVWQSKGRLTSTGYEVEIQIPFKSIRFQDTKTQTWGINVLRTVQRSGQEQTWTSVKRAASSFLAQSGRLEGLTDLSVGHTLDLVPTMTSSVAGGAKPGSTTREWEYGGGKPQFGGSLRYGITPNLTLNGTAKPDFSQVESDAGQFSFDPRQALSFPERRPFFLEGIEQFDAPSGLIYTRRIVQPVVATKLTGKVGGTQIGILGALDDRDASRHDELPRFGVLRLSRDLGPGSRLGATWTEQADGPDHNRVVGLDGRMVLGGIHSLTFNGAWAHDDRSGVELSAPIWAMGYRLNGRSLRGAASINGVHEDFRTRSGFVSRPGVAHAAVSQSYVWYPRNSAIETISADLVLDGTWIYRDFAHGGPMQDRKLHPGFSARLKGGWDVGAQVWDENFGYDPALYANYRLLTPTGELLAFTPEQRIPNRDYFWYVNTPNLKGIRFNGNISWGHDENFFEWTSGKYFYAQAGMDIRPTEQLRLGLSYIHTVVNRINDGSQVSLQMVPRVKLEYQATRDLRIRLVSQYALDTRDSLRDNSRTELPIVTLNPDGSYTRASAYRDGRLRTDFLVSYAPNPGTVVYLGYGASHAELDDTGRQRLTRTGDGLFMKFSYLWRIEG